MIYIKILIINQLVKLNFYTKNLYILFSVLEYIIKLLNLIYLVPNYSEFITRRLNMACVHGMVGLCALCHQAKQSTIIACTHTWTAFTDPTMGGVACNFNLPIHTAATTAKAVVHICSICHAVACSGCYTG